MNFLQQQRCKEICRKVNAKVSVLRRIRKFIPFEVMLRVYKAFILPHLEYSSQKLIGIGKGQSLKLEHTNAYALRTLLNRPKETSYDELLRLASIKSLEHRRFEQALILVHKSLHGKAPNYISDMFTLCANN